jgi:shikimate dehydrogenase
MSRPYAEVIGDPIAHSKSPLIHNFWLEKLGIDAEYRACHVRPAQLADYFAQRREDEDWRGCNVTIPHKEAVAALIDETDAMVSGIGAVNAVVRGKDGKLAGTNTDVVGIADAVAGMQLSGRIAVVIGAGGAARAAFWYLATRGCASVRVLARSPEKAVRAASDNGLAIDAISFTPASGAALSGASLLINATQLGMIGQEPMPRTLLDALPDMASDALVFDMVYAPLETELLRTARERGMRTADGLVMLVGQAGQAFELFFGRSPPHGAYPELRRILTS